VLHFRGQIFSGPRASQLSEGIRGSLVVAVCGNPKTRANTRNDGGVKTVECASILVTKVTIKPTMGFLWQNSFPFPLVGS